MRHVTYIPGAPLANNGCGIYEITLTGSVTVTGTDEVQIIDADLYNPGGSSAQDCETCYPNSAPWRRVVYTGSVLSGTFEVSCTWRVYLSSSQAPAPGPAAPISGSASGNPRAVCNIYLLPAGWTIGARIIVKRRSGPTPCAVGTYCPGECFDGSTGTCGDTSTNGTVSLTGTATFTKVASTNCIGGAC